MAKISEEDYTHHMGSVVAEGFILNPAGYERISSWALQLTNLVTARRNFEWVRDEPYIEGDLDNVLKTQAFFVAAVAAYGRCYAKSGQGLPSLSAKDVYNGASDGMDVHERLMKLRNKFAAHTDHSDLTRLTLAVKDDGETIEIRHLNTIATPYDEISDFLEAVDHTEWFVQLSLNKQLDYMEKQKGRKIVIVQ